AAWARPIRALSPSPPSCRTGARTTGSSAPRPRPSSPKPRPDNDSRRGRPMKKFVNDPAQFVPEFMKGIAMANPDLLEFTPEFQMIVRKGGVDKSKVSVVQGSGSGHEPAHVMAVGPGMLTGACQGAVFAAPAVDSCYETIKACASDAGVLVLVNNYQGDRMAWDMATELAQAEGINVKQFWINDDVAVEDSLYTVGRRGVAGNFFVIKCCGAAADAGA